MKTIKIQNTEIQTRESFLNSIIERAKEIESNIYSESTKNAIKIDCNQFQNFCASTNLEINEFSFFVFLTEISKTRKASTLKRKASLIQKIVKVTNTEKFKNILKGASNTINKTNSKKQATAITKNIIENSTVSKQAVSLIEKRNKAIILMSFYGAFRTSEIINLQLNNITFESDGIVVKIENSKTDKNKEGLFKFIPYNFANKNICPVLALKDYLESANIQNGIIFRSIQKGGKVTENKLNRSNTNLIVKDAFNSNFSTHGLRAGFVTEASNKGATIQQIMQQTNHKTAQNVICYVRSIDVKKNNAVSII